LRKNKPPAQYATLKSKPTPLFRAKLLYRVIYAQKYAHLLTQKGKDLNGSPRSIIKEVGLPNEALLLWKISNEFHHCCIPLHHQLCKLCIILDCACAVFASSTCFYLRVCNCLTKYSTSSALQIFPEAAAIRKFR